MVKSLMDYLGRWLALKFMAKDKAKRFHNADLIDRAYREGSKSSDAFAMRLPVVDEGSDAVHFGADQATAEIQTEEETDPTLFARPAAVVSKKPNAKAQGYTGSICSACGSSRMKRNGSCELCVDCGETSGCS